MPIQPHKFDYPKKVVHYRGGTYPIRRISYYPKDSPGDIKHSCVMGGTLDRILSDDSGSKIEEIAEAAQKLDKKIAFTIANVLFLSPGAVIKDVLQKGNEEFVFTYVSD